MQISAGAIVKGGGGSGGGDEAREVGGGHGKKGGLPGRRALAFERKDEVHALLGGHLSELQLAEFAPPLLLFAFRVIGFEEAEALPFDDLVFSVGAGAVELNGA